ncbi:ATP-binding protein [Breoghania sp. L-A4]|uniref:sensor histidine kinase n=1 Tax=Breoghania sp. L-A4 TaxID=2304600 RepID=UPI000E35862A|nr:ATP-binding protein [Breoghania sp. L-A4]AXS41880.1 PAS domain S-box protein [Breoghania sp. L-A4]
MADTGIFTMDTLRTAACRFTANTTIIYFNSLFSTVFDRDSEPCIGSRLLDMVPEAFHADLAALAGLTPQNPSSSVRIPIVDGKGGSIPLVWDCKADFTPEGSLRFITAFARPASDDLNYRTAIESLLKVANDPALDYDARACGILTCARNYFDMDTAHVERLSEDGAFTEVDQRGLGDITAQDRQSIPLADTALGLLIDSGKVLAVPDIGKTPHAALSEKAPLSPVALLASGIYVNRKLYGAVVFASNRPRTQQFSSQQTQYCTLVGQWLGFIIEQHRFLTELQLRERKYRHLFEDAPAMISILDASERISDVNNSWLTTLGYERTSVIGRRVTDFFAAPHANGPTPELQHDVHNVPLDLVTRDGQIVQSRLSTLGSTEATSATLAVMVDVTERNRVLLDLTNIRKTLTKANEELKRFNAIAAHDLQEPLRKIRLFGGILKSALKDTANPEIETAIEKIIDAANRLTTLVKDLLLYSRESERSYARQKVNLAPLLDEAINDLALIIADTDAQIRIFDLPEIEGDPVPLQRLFTNLILNALKYRREDINPEIEIFARTGAEESLELIVRDNGIGFKPGEERKIFAPFVRIQPEKSSGSGIGLAICKSIATGHGWTIRAENRAAGGPTSSSPWIGKRPQEPRRRQHRTNTRPRASVRRNRHEPPEPRPN